MIVILVLHCITDLTWPFFSSTEQYNLWNISNNSSDTVCDSVQIRSHVDTHDYSFDGRSQKVCGHSSRNPPSSFFHTTTNNNNHVLWFNAGNENQQQHPLYLLFSYRVGQEHMLMLLMFMIWEPHYYFLRRLYNNREYILFIITRKSMRFMSRDFRSPNQPLQAYGICDQVTYLFSLIKQLNLFNLH